jgi:hypothetical protein
VSSTKPLSPRTQQAFAQLITERIGVTFRKNDYAGFQDFIFSRIKILKLRVPEEYYLLLNANTDKSHQEW